MPSLTTFFGSVFKCTLFLLLWIDCHPSPVRETTGDGHIGKWFSFRLTNCGKHGLKKHQIRILYNHITSLSLFLSYQLDGQNVMDSLAMMPRSILLFPSSATELHLHNGWITFDINFRIIRMIVWLVGWLGNYSPFAINILDDSDSLISSWQSAIPSKYK